jgi:hypothetical protein
MLKIELWPLLQASKLALGKNQSITALYDNMVVVHVNHLPIVITLVGEPNGTSPQVSLPCSS